jgi:ubiquinone/menaquinone biosynthesis C-methylase UbiE
MYAKQDHMTPGAAQTVDIITDSVPFGGAPRLLEMASGKGAAAATLASRHICRIVCVEPHGSFVRQSVDRFSRLGLRGVRVVQGDGRRLPIRNGVMDAAYCIGAPSIVGLRPALTELTRVVHPGARVIVSDITWREQPGPLGREWGWAAAAAQTSTEQYVDELTSVGLLVDRVVVHGRDAWDEYWQPLRLVADEARSAGDLAFADETQQLIDVERRAVNAWLDYTTFIAVRP